MKRRGRPRLSDKKDSSNNVIFILKILVNMELVVLTENDLLRVLRFVRNLDIPATKAMVVEYVSTIIEEKKNPQGSA